MIAISEQWGDVPPYWSVYFAAADCDISVATAQGLGANVLVPGQDIEPGRFSVIQDPQGGTFTILQLKQILA